MNKHHSYNNIIEKKLEQLPVPDADHLWNDMHMILDEKMPQKKERRRFIAWWFLSGRVLMLLSSGIFIITATSLYFLSKNVSRTIITKTSSHSRQTNNSNENNISKILKDSKENIETNSEQDQKTKGNILSVATAINDLDLATFDNLKKSETQKKSKKYITQDQFHQSNLRISNSTQNLDFSFLELEAIQHNILVTIDLNAEKEYLNPELKPVAEKKVKLNPTNKNKNESGFYAGIMTGVDLSSINFKSAKTGTNKGFIVGYGFNKKWSIESGLLWDTKRIYDDGTHFNPPGYTPTNGIKIIAVNGKSRIFELPVNVKYTITSGKHILFATTGLSSYFMNSENYDYEYTQNNQPGGHNYISYKNVTKDWLSVANFSLGYTHRFGEMGSIRVEPYLKLPLKNIGIGNMPIMSTGLNVGVVKRLR